MYTCLYLPIPTYTCLYPRILYLTIPDYSCLYPSIPASLTGCMDAWLKAFEQNVTLVELKWRLDSRKSFKLNKDLIRNKSIAKAKKEGAFFKEAVISCLSIGKDWDSLLPDHLRTSSPADPPVVRDAE